MDNILIPLQITKDGVLLEKNQKKAIDRSIALLLQTACYSWAADPQYGFLLKNLRFEIFNESEGTIYNSYSKNSDPQYNRSIYNMKVTGTSKNLSTFAAELKSGIERYEPRLQEVSTALTYIREERKVYVSVRGVMVDTDEEYQYETIIRIWK